LSSGKCEIHGNGGVARSRRASTSNGEMVIHARPSNVSIGSSAGTAGLSTRGSSGQCMNSSRSQV
jgi:hypothetical protein